MDTIAKSLRRYRKRVFSPVAKNEKGRAYAHGGLKSQKSDFKMPIFFIVPFIF